MSSYPKTEAEWWELFHANHERLRSIVAEYHPARRAARKHSGNITAPAAEALCAAYDRQIAAEADWEDPLIKFDRFVHARDGVALACLLSQAWVGVPESTDCWRILGFGVLCDLCSEAHLVAGEGAWDDE